MKEWVLLKETNWKITSQEGGFLSFHCALMTDSWRLVKNVSTPLVKSVLVPLGLTAAASATNLAYNFNEVMDDITKTVLNLLKNTLY